MTRSIKSWEDKVVSGEKVRYFMSGQEDVGDNSRVILDQMTEVDGVKSPVVALPDLHFKYSYSTPTGVVVLVKDRIVPRFVNANCGMSFVKTPFFREDLDEEKLDGIFTFLRNNISISTRMSPVISEGELEEIIMRGAAWTFDRFGLNSEDIKNFENEGNLFKDDPRTVGEIMRYIPRTSRNVGRLSLGVLGYGNHFIELQAVDDILNAEVAGHFGLKKGQLCFMIHGDSRAFGQSLIDSYSGKAKKLLGLQQFYKGLHYAVLASERAPLPLKVSVEKLNFFLNRLKSSVYWKTDKVNRKTNITFAGLEAGTEEAIGYETSTSSAINFGYANRAYFAALIRDALKKTFGKESVEVRVLHDGNHDALQRENIDGEEYFVHRNGAARALPPGVYPDHPVFSRTGQPVLLPSSLGRPSFLCAATKGCPGSYYSTCHGAGRRIDRGQAREQFSAGDVFEEVRAAEMKIYDYGRGKVQEEAPGAFKDAREVLRAMAENNIAEPVAELRPLGALKGWR